MGVTYAHQAALRPALAKLHERASRGVVPGSEAGTWGCWGGLPSGKHTKNYGKSPFLMGKSTISMAIFNSYVKLPESSYGVLVGGLGMSSSQLLLTHIFQRGRSTTNQMGLNGTILWEHEFKYNFTNQQFSRNM